MDASFTGAVTFQKVTRVSKNLSKYNILYDYYNEYW